MAGDQLLFLELARALGQPSKAYRAADAGISIFDKGLSGYEAGTDLHEKLRKRKVAQQTLRDVLGENVPDRFSKVADIPGEQVPQFGGLRHLVDDELDPLQSLKADYYAAKTEALRNPKPPVAKPKDPLDEEYKRARIDALKKGPAGVATKELALNKVSGKLKELRGLYGELDKSKAIVSSERDALSNIKSSAASSRLGQSVSRTVGTKDQVFRDRINQMRPLLINDIRQASQMGARGLDSEKELFFFLQAATDPTRDIQVNLNAIDVLDRAYGLGLDIPGGNSGGGSAGGGPKVKVSNGQEVLEIDPTDIPDAVRDGYRPVQ